MFNIKIKDPNKVINVISFIFFDRYEKPRIAKTKVTLPNVMNFSSSILEINELFERRKLEKNSPIEFHFGYISGYIDNRFLVVYGTQFSWGNSVIADKPNPIKHPARNNLIFFRKSFSLFRIFKTMNKVIDDGIANIKIIVWVR